MLERNVRAGEKALIISSTDLDTDVYNAMASAAYSLGAEVTIALMNPLTKVGQLPPKPILEAMKYVDIVIPCASASLVHGEFLMELQRKGIKTVSCDAPRGVQDILDNAVYRNLDKYKKHTIAIQAALRRAKTVTVHTDGESKLTANIEGMKAIMAGYSIAESPRYEAVFPPAECHIAVKEGSANGVVVINHAIQTREKISKLGLGKVNEPVKLYFENGWLKKIEGGISAQALEEVLVTADENGRKFCEVGFGANEDVKAFSSAPGIFSKLDKKILGSTHIALGRNYDAAFSARLDDGTYVTDGTIKSNLHLDMVMRNATIETDVETIVENGKLLIEP